MNQTIIAQCPSCESRYKVTSGQLKVAQGQVRCGRCLTVFEAIPPTSKKTANQTPAMQAPEPSGTEVASDNQPQISETLVQCVIKKPDTTQPKSMIQQIQALNLPPPELNQPVSQKKFPTLAILGSVLALGILVGQHLWFERAHLSNHSSLRSIYTLACDYLDCSLSSYQGLSALRTTHLVVREVSENPEVLELLTGLHNEHTLPVQLPHLRILFTDLQGQIIAAQDFTPATYRPHAATLLPNERLETRLFIELPTAGHLGYEIEWIPH